MRTLLLVVLVLLPISAWGQNPYYDHGSYPAPGTTASSAGMRAELDLIEAGFSKLPTLSGNANKAVVVNGSGNALATTTGTLTLSGNLAVSGGSAVTLTTTGPTTLTLPTTGTLATLETAIPRGPSFPPFPGLDDLFWLTTDGAPGECSAGAGTIRSLCYYDGADWVSASSAAASSDTLGAVAARGNTITGADETNPVEIFGTGGQSTYGLVFDRTSTGESRIRCKEPAGIDQCHYFRQLQNGFNGGFKDKDGTERLTVSGTTGAVTNVTLDAEATGNNITLYRKLCGGNLVGVDPATGTAGHIADKDQLSSTPTATTITGTNQTYGVLRFPDVDGEYGVTLSCLLPTGFTGAIDFVATGKTSGTGVVVMQIGVRCYASDAANDAAYSAVSSYLLSAGTSGRLNRYSGTGIAATGCAANNLAFFRVFRNRTHGSDTLNNTFDLKDFELWARRTH